MALTVGSAKEGENFGMAVRTSSQRTSSLTTRDRHGASTNHSICTDNHLLSAHRQSLNFRFSAAWANLSQERHGPVFIHLFNLSDTCVWQAAASYRYWVARPATGCAYASLRIQAIHQYVGQMNFAHIHALQPHLRHPRLHYHGTGAALILPYVVGWG